MAYKEGRLPSRPRQIGNAFSVAEITVSCDSTLYVITYMHERGDEGVLLRLSAFSRTMRPESAIVCAIGSSEDDADTEIPREDFRGED